MLTIYEVNTQDYNSLVAMLPKKEVLKILNNIERKYYLKNIYAMVIASLNSMGLNLRFIFTVFTTSFGCIELTFGGHVYWIKPDDTTPIGTIKQLKTVDHMSKGSNVMMDVEDKYRRNNASQDKSKTTSASSSNHLGELENNHQQGHKEGVLRNPFLRGKVQEETPISRVSNYSAWQSDDDLPF